MTESPFAFQDEDASGPVEQVDQESGGKRRTLIGVGALLSLALAGGAFLLLGGDEPTEEVAFTPVKRTPKVQAPASPLAPGGAVTPVRDPAATGTNPFKALYVLPVVAPAPAAPAAAPAPAPATTAPPVVLVTTSQNSAGTTTTKVATSPAPVVRAPAPAPAPVASPTPKPVPVTSTVKLKQVSTDTGVNVGTFVLNGETFMGGKAAVLGGKILVKELTKNADDVWVATLQVGDGTPFDVYLGQEVVVQ